MLNFTNAPLPSWMQFAKVLFIKATDTQIIKPWLQNDEQHFWFSRSAWSLYAIALFRIKFFGQDNIQVWVPGFYCNASLSLLRDLGVELQFYPLLLDGKPDMDRCKLMLEQSSPDLILFVNYFGEMFDAKDLASFAKNNNAWLVEDCAHCLKPENGIGLTGDFVLYSPHKFLALPDGALLLIRSDGPSNLTKVEFDDVYNKLLLKEKSSFLTSVKWLIKRFIQKLGIRRMVNFISYQHDDIKTNSSWLPGPKMSTLAKSFLYLMIPELENEARNRKRNALEWKSELLSHYCLKQDVKALFRKNTPYLAGFQVETKAQAKKIFDRLQNANVPVTTWPDLSPEVLHDMPGQNISIERRYTRFYLPVHSSVEPKKIRETIRCIQ